MPYFDLHCHPGLKTLFRPQDGSQLSAWQNVQAPTFLVGDILCSQSSLGQISAGGQMPLICITLHPPEAGMLDQLVIKLAAGSLWSKLLDEGRLDTLISGDDGYQHVFYEELANLLAPPRPADGITADVKVKFLKDWTDFDPSDKSTVHVVFNIEGGHAIYPQGVMGDGLDDPKPALDNLAAFLNRNFLTLYLTPTHLTPNSFINHAYGNKILTKGPLLPRGFGITTDGLALIKSAYDRGLLIDVKHMSLLSRLQFYRIHDRHFPGKPIIASHVGLTGAFAFEPGANFLGWSTDQHVHGDYVRVNGVNTPGLLNKTSFYPLSINLFDQDVEAIMRSGGLIGISMDVRILGGKDNGQALVSDYLSTKEYGLLVQGEDACMVQINTLADNLWAGAVVKAPALGAMPELPDFKLAILEELEDIFTSGASPSVGPDARAHARLIANHLLQLLFISRNAGPNLIAQTLGQALARDADGLALPWNNICIGSDFDGLIEAVDCCKNVTALGAMAELLIQELNTGAAELHWDLGMPTAQIVAQFCYTNAFNFLNKHFGG